MPECYSGLKLAGKGNNSPVSKLARTMWVRICGRLWIVEIFMDSRASPKGLDSYLKG